MLLSSKKNHVKMILAPNLYFDIEPQYLKLKIQLVLNLKTTSLLSTLPNINPPYVLFWFVHKIYQQILRKCYNQVHFNLE